MFLGMDSDRSPVKSYADIAFVIYGSMTRHVISLLQSMQLLFNLDIIILTNCLSLERIITGSDRVTVCFILVVFI